LLNPIRSKTFDRGVAKADEDLGLVERTYAGALGQSSTQAAAAGDVDKELETVQRKFDQASFDPRLGGEAGVPDDPTEVSAWAARLKNQYDMIPQIIEFMDRAQSNSVKAQSPDFRAYAHWFRNSVKRGIEEAVGNEVGVWNREVREGVLPLEQGESGLRKMATDQDAVKWYLKDYTLGKSQLANLMAYEEAWYGSVQKGTLEYARRYEKMGEFLSQALTDSIKNQAMPAPAAVNPELIKLAQKMLAGLNPEYHVLGPVKAMRVVGDLVQEEEWRFEDNAWRQNRWELFGVAFAEQIKGRWYITYASFKKNLAFYGGHSRGIGQWYTLNVTPVGMGQEIPEQNIR
jgi:hypothetical protein